MPKQGGQGKGKPKLKDKDFGKALIKRQMQGAKGIDYKEKHVNMMSMLETSALEDYVASSEMAGTAVPVHRVHQYDAFLVEPSVTTTIQSMSTNNYDYKHLKIPRKPAWNREMTGEEVDRREKDAFLAWRRDIAGMELANQSLKVTPFEKNIEVWRQLWRVLERSDMAIQIVDARNPLLYYTSDLMKYALEQSPPKHMVLLVNKADFLTDYQRLHWAKQLTSMGIKYVFYSAFYEQEKLDANTSDSNVVDAEEMESLAQDITSSISQDANGGTDKKDSIHSLEEAERIKCRSKVLNRDEMILLLQLIPAFLGIQPQPRHGDRVCIGMLGYPNVGKSSVINTLLGVSKSTHGVVRVGVSSTPGKTKHFQTLMVNETVMLCDCPGLVFPSFMASTGEMLCSGILPINQMRDYVDPANVIACRVPMHLLEAAYGMHIQRDLDLMDNPERPPTGHEMLSAYCAVKGYITNGTGRWDEFRACKEMLRDFNDGLILYVSVPAVVTDVDRWLLESEKVMVRREKIAERIALLRIKEAEEEITLGSTKKHSTGGEVESDMVFGDGKYDNNNSDDEEEDGGDGAADVDTVSREEEEYAAAYDESVTTGTEEGAESSTKREHKRLKHWGKKNRKLRDKDPYGEDNGVISYVAYTTNRQKAGGAAKSKVIRQNPLVPYGSVFLRPEFPHQLSK